MSQFVEIKFDCLPLRSVGTLSIPADASPKYQARCERILRAIATLGTYNTYFLYNAQAIFHLTNEPTVGMLQFWFEGAVVTDESDQFATHAALEIRLERETCDWLTQPVVEWFTQTVPQAVKVEFNRYIAAGDLAAAIRRHEQLQAASDAQGGYMGMFL